MPNVVHLDLSKQFLEYLVIVQLGSKDSTSAVKTQLDFTGSRRNLEFGNGFSALMRPLEAITLSQIAK